jgi:hypothetical protein
MALFLGVLLCFGSGFLLVSLGWPGSRALSSELLSSNPLSSDLLLRTSLSAGYGLGIFSVVFFLARVWAVTNVIAIDVAVFVLLAVLLAARWRFARRRRSSAEILIATSSETSEQISELRPAWLYSILRVSVWLALGAALYAAILSMLAYPHGNGWDAFAIWNLHARFLFLGGEHWRDGFTAFIPWSHPDYPLLLPAAIAHFWTYLGHDDPRVPAAIGFLFTFATVGVLFAALAILRGRVQAMLGALALLATPAFIVQGTWQYADVPLSFFMLATIALLCLHERNARVPAAQSFGLLALAGVAAGFAGWTKNEGLLFLCAVIVARQVAFMGGSRSGGGAEAKVTFMQRSGGWLIAGCAPLVLLIVWFKHAVAPPGDLFSDPATTLHKLLTPARYWAVIQWYAKTFLRFGQWWLIPVPLLLVGYYLAVGRAAGKDDAGTRQAGFRSSLRTSALALGLTLAGYFAVYIITPYDIYWHLRFSLGRLFLQVWPSAVFLFFLGARLFPGDISPGKFS